MRAANVDLRNGIMFFQARAQTQIGAWIAGDLVVKVDSTATASEKGAAAMQVLSASQHGVPHPKDWSNVGISLLRAAGVKSFSVFNRLANKISLELELDDVFLKILPHRRGPGTEAFPLPEETIQLPVSASPEEIGAAIEEAFSRCQPGPKRGAPGSTHIRPAGEQESP